MPFINLSWLFKSLVCFGLVATFTFAQAEEPGELEQKGAAALKLSQTDENAIVSAAVFYGKAADGYETAGDGAKATEMNSYLYWCKKKMTLAQMDVFLAEKNTDSAAAVKRFAALEKAALSPEQAQIYFDRAEAFATSKPNEHLLVAIRFFEVADRFKGTDVSLKAQDRSLTAMQEVMKRVAAGVSGKKAVVAAIPVAGSPAPVGRAVEILKHFDTANAKNGSWKFEQNVLRCTEEVTNARLILPFTPGAEYDVHVAFKRLSGIDGIGLIFPVNGQQAVLTIGGWGNKLGGISLVNNQPANVNPTRFDIAVEPNALNDLRLQVRNNAITATLNDKKVVDLVLTGLTFKLDLSTTLDDVRALGLHSVRAKSEFSIVEVTDVSGGGVLIGSAVAAVEAPPAAPIKKKPLPSAQQQKESETVIRDIYKDELAKTTPADRTALAKKLEAQSAENANDPAAQYVLLQISAKLAAQNGDLEQFISITERIEQTFEGNTETPMKANLTLLANASKLPAIQKTAAALRTLVDKPDDAAAALAAGKYHALTRGDWARGLPLLAKSSNPTLKGASIQDLAAPTVSATQATLGDVWWDLSEKADKEDQRGYGLRAAYWYRKALPELSGLTKAKIEKRINTFTETKVATVTPEKKPAVTEIKPVERTRPASSANGDLLEIENGVIKGGAFNKSKRLEEGTYKGAGSLVWPSNMDAGHLLTIEAGVDLSHCTFAMNWLGRIRGIGTADKPIIFRNCNFLGSWSTTAEFEYCIFDKCKFEKTGSESRLGVRATVWKCKNCIFNAHQLPGMGPVNYGFTFTESAFNNVTFPDVRWYGKDKTFDHTTHLRQGMSTLADCTFIECTFAPFAAWTATKSNFYICKFTGNELYDSDSELVVDSYFLQPQGIFPVQAKRKPVVFTPAKSPVATPRLPDKCPLPELQGKLKLLYPEAKK